MNRRIRATVFVLGLLIAFTYVGPTGGGATLGVLVGVLAAVLAADAFAGSLRSPHRSTIVRWSLRVCVFGATSAMMYSYLAPMSVPMISVVALVSAVSTLLVERGVRIASMDSARSRI